MHQTRAIPLAALVACLMFVTCAWSAGPPPITPVVYDDAISREIMALTGPPVTPVVQDDANSREITALTGPPITPVVQDDANSREVTVGIGPAPPSVAKMMRLGLGVGLEPGIVTASFPGFFYVESADRSSGVMVAWNSPVTEGSLVQVAGGTALSSDKERYVVATGVTASGTGSVRPLGIGPARLGGGSFLYTPGGTAGQPGTQAWDWMNSAVVDVSGLNNIGLLVTTWGKVKWAGTNAFIIDDGSGSMFGDPTAPGVRILVPAGVSVPAVNTWASVTGISSCYQLNGTVYRLLRVRKSEDIRPYSTH